jgi:hypothetical protein
MATLEVAFLHSQLEERKRPWEAAIALTPQKAGLAGLLREARLLHLLDEEKRRELMINYGEDLLPTGFTAGELSEGGKPTIGGRVSRTPCSNVRRVASQLSRHK